MAIRKNVVADLLNTAKMHDDLAKSKGFQADSTTDRAAADHQKALRDATPEERALYRRIYE